MQDEILRLKKENDVCILAHRYQAREIVEIADFSGDSYQLSVMAQKAPSETVLMACGLWRNGKDTVRGQARILSIRWRAVLWQSR